MEGQGSTETVPIYQLKVTLKDIKPPIWRRFLIRSDSTLDRVHDVLQVVMGWTDSHLHQFVARTLSYSAPRMCADMNEWMEDEQPVALTDVLRQPGDKIEYLYDFGDGWEHQILLEKVLDPDATMRHPVCVKGKRACPPEDCGGVWGYTELLDILATPDHPEHATMLEWAGGPIDPEAFDIDAVNRDLAVYG